MQASLPFGDRDCKIACNFALPPSPHKNADYQDCKIAAQSWSHLGLNGNLVGETKIARLRGNLAQIIVLPAHCSNSSTFVVSRESVE